MIGLIKNIIFVIFSGIIIISAIANITSQNSLLKEANVKNQKMEEKIEDLLKENNQLRRKVEYATSSAAIDRQMRDKLSLGTANDSFLVLPEIEGEVDMYPQLNLGDQDPPVKQWIMLFTR